MHYSIGPIPWSSDGWAAPATVVGMVDLARNVDYQPGLDRGIVFFASLAPLGSAYTEIGSGDCRQAQADAAMIAKWTAATTFTPQGSLLVDLLWDHLTRGADPDGNLSCPPLMPTVQGQLELHLGGHSLVKSDRFVFGSHPHSSKVEAMRQRHFAQYFADAEAGRTPREFPLRILDKWCENYRINKSDRAAWQRLIPPHLRRHVAGPLPHQTTITDDFTRANGTTIGNQLSWTEMSGDFQTLSNAVTKDNGSNDYQFCRADTSLSDDDVYAQVVVKSFDYGQGPVCRLPTSATIDGYATHNQSNAIYLDKFIAAGRTNLANTSLTYTAGHTYKVESNGSTIKAYTQGTERLSATDTAITGNLRCGMVQRFHSTLVSLDDFEAADLSAPASRIDMLSLLGVS